MIQGINEQLVIRQRDVILRQLSLSSVGSGARRTSPQTASRRHASLLAFVRRYAPSNAATRQPGLRPVRKIVYWLKKDRTKMVRSFFNRQLSILPGRFQPSTFDV